MATCTRKYVAVKASFNEDGVLMSRQIVWEDDRGFDVDRVLDIRTASSLKAGSGVNVNINLYKKWKIIMYKFNGSSLLPCE